ncbi:tRNA (guanine-N(1)-)-methyltransferase [bacterium HR17]|uniref:tRNA (guanine-N(1)-)-methyltransferase n=1 Tax=Candidatus Fervidibacter japonicus TaxID=2035412 RepID=A0A2H5X8Y6_9BACT|nr:tRNA (guanine-N(1)-)-methyltransferase [bacterium HR17]
MAKVTFHVFTLFPEWFVSPLKVSIIGRAIQDGHIAVHCHNIRDYTTDKHRTVDDYPFGGGAGLVLKPEPIFAAVESVLGQLSLTSPPPVILLCAQGRPFTQSVARQLAQHSTILLICGHYEGVDERVRAHLVTDELSIGDYILTGGEPAALVVIDAVTRLVPGVIDEASPVEESFADGLLEYPQYTRPRVFRGWAVPDVLVSGDHEAIRRWRRREALKRTLLRRPDLLVRATLTEEDWQMLREIESELSRTGQLFPAWRRWSVLP